VNETLHPVTMGRGRIWLERIMYALMVALVTISLLIAIAAVFQAWFNDPPVHVESMDKHPTQPFCPGDAFPITNRVTIDRPTILFLYVSVMDEGTNFNIPDTSISLGPRLHPHPSTFPQYVLWTVPSLPAGHYNRTFAVRGHDTDERPIFVFTPFTVGEDCEL
jgi:hypothetical protein